MSADFFAKVGTDVRRSRNQGFDEDDIGSRLSSYGVSNRYSYSDGAYWPSPGIAERLEPGFYAPEYCHNRGVILQKRTVVTDDLVRLPDAVSDALLSEFITFWGALDKLKAHGVMVKRGLLLWGPPGSGKTSGLNLMAAHMIKEIGGAVLLVQDPMLAIKAVQIVRQVEPARPLILVYEDMDSLVERYGDGRFLSILDGDAQISNVVNVATTNYPERLDKRFVDRPGRFDRVTECPMPSLEARRAYLDAKASELPVEMRAKWASLTDGWSVAHLRELVVAHLALGEPAPSVFERLEAMRTIRADSAKVGRAPMGVRVEDQEEVED